jgi:ubiquinone/menaquinone biosynthesis C-methylase UbiE
MLQRRSELRSARGRAPAWAAIRLRRSTAVISTDARYDGAIPEFYDRYLGPVLFEPYAAELAARVQAPPAGAVLEIACGTGVLTRALRARLPASASLVASDLSEAMLERARSRSPRTDSLEWRREDAAALALPGGAFCAVACQFGAVFFPDRRAAFSEVRRVLAPGGSFVFCVWGDFEGNPYAGAAHAALAQLLPADPPQFFRVPFGSCGEAELRELLEASGFEKLEVEWIDLEAVSPSAADFAAGLIRGYPVSLALRERGAPLESAVEAVCAALVRVGGDYPFRAPMQALVIAASARA